MADIAAPGAGMVAGVACILGFGAVARAWWNRTARRAAKFWNSLADEVAAVVEMDSFEEEGSEPLDLTDHETT